MRSKVRQSKLSKENLPYFMHVLNLNDIELLGEKMNIQKGSLFA